jgi:hypothetical protein
MMSVCLSQQHSGKDGCLWSEGRLQRRLDGEERAGSFDLPCYCDSEGFGGSGSALCTCLCRGAVFDCTLLHCPSRTMFSRPRISSFEIHRSIRPASLKQRN